MTPDKRVEEMVEKLAVMTCIVNWLGKEALERVKAEMKTTLTQYHQDSTEAERDRIASLCYQLDTDGEKMYQLIYKEV